MTQQQENLEPVANPYNARKSWHDVEEHENITANELYFEREESEPQEATSEETPAPRKKRGRPENSTNYKKRYDDLKRHYDDKIAEFKQREQELIAQANISQPEYRPPRTKEELEEFKANNPELFDTVETVAHLRSQEELASVKEKLAAIEKREASIARKEAESKLRERHPDFEDIRSDDKFHTWAKEQPQEIQNWIYRNPDNVSLASRAIDFYKMEKGIKIYNQKSSKKAPSNEAADFVSTKTTAVDAKQPKIWTEREIAKLSADEFERYEQEIDRAIQEGRVRK